MQSLHSGSSQTNQKPGTQTELGNNHINREIAQPSQAAIETKPWLTKSNHRTQNHVQNRTQQTQYALIALMIRNHRSTTHLGLSAPTNRQSETKEMAETLM
jgi:hypothetical protein